jgi:hypothetical protein
MINLLIAIMDIGRNREREQVRLAALLDLEQRHFSPDDYVVLLSA